MFTSFAYLVYLGVSIATTVWVGRTLHKNGRTFLVDTFHGNEPLADSVNHLLVVGFYLVNSGFIALALKTAERPGDLEGGIELLSTKLGYVWLALGVMHFFNLYVFSKLRKRALVRTQGPPVAPQEYVRPVVTAVRAPA